MSDIDILMQRYLDGGTSLQEERHLAELIERNPDATAAEKAVAAMLRGRRYDEAEIEQWLDEDDTALYDSIIAQRKSHGNIVKWAVAASVAIVLCLSSWLFFTQESGDSAPIAKQVQPVRTMTPAQMARETPKRPAGSTPVVRQTVAAKSARTARVAVAENHEKTAIDDFQNAVAAIEARLDKVVDSVSQAQAEQVIAADAHLSRLAYDTRNSIHPAKYN